MKATTASLKMLIRHISRDGMMVLLCFAPLLVLLLLGYVFPTYIEPLLPFSISEYYILLDLMIAVMTPYLFCFASSLAMLEEIDDNIAPYLSVTPVGKNGYLFSRLLLPAAISSLITVIFLNIVSLSDLSLLMIVMVSISTATLAMIISMIVIGFAKNKVEGMALSKLSGLLLIGLFIPSFISGGIQYIFGFSPSFWIAKLAISDNYLYLLPIIICSAIWIAVLMKIYKRKLL